MSNGYDIGMFGAGKQADDFEFDFGIKDAIQMISPIKFQTISRTRKMARNYVYVHEETVDKMVYFAHFALSYCDVCACYCITFGWIKRNWGLRASAKDR